MQQKNTETLKGMCLCCWLKQEHIGAILHVYVSCFLTQLKQFIEVSERQGKAFGIAGLTDS